MTPLRQRMIEDMQLRNLCPATQRNYVHHVPASPDISARAGKTWNLEAVRQYKIPTLPAE